MVSNKKFGLSESLIKAVAEATKAHTVPKTEKEKKLAALAEPKDKITHADVLTGRGVRKEEVEEVVEFDEATSYALIHSSTGKEVDRGSKDDMVKKVTAGHHVAAVQKPAGASTLSRLARKLIPGQGQKQAGERAKDQGYSAGLDRAALKYHPDDKKLATTMKSSEKAQKRYERISRGEAPFKSSPNDTRVKEEVEPIEELSKATLASYAKKAVSDARFKQGIGKDYEALGKRKRDQNTKAAFANAGRKYRMKAKDREIGAAKAIDRLAKEEVELGEISDVAHAKYRLAARADIKTQSKMLDADSKAGDRIQKRVDGLARSTGLERVKKMTKEEKDTPGNSYEHQCAVHVKHAKLGEGKTLFSQHADPAEDGSIEWYDVMFEHGIERVQTSDIEILVSESHMNHKKKVK